jgi:hypothetical protein
VDRDTLIETLAAVARRDAPEGPEPEVEALYDYLAGRLPEEAERRLQRRLVAEPALARKLLDLQELAAAEAAAADAPADLAARAGWRDFQARLSTAAPVPARTRRPPAWLTAAAAALLAATVGLGGWVWRLETRGGRPVANLKTLELAAVRAAPGSTALAAGEPLRIALRPEARCASYAAAVAGPRPGDLVEVPPLVADERGLLVFLLPPLAPGAYTVLLSGCEPGREPERFPFRVVRPGEPGG